MTSEPVDTTSKKRRRQTYRTVALPSQRAPLLLIAKKPSLHLRSCFLVKHCYVQRIAREAPPRSMNVGGTVQKL